MAIQAEPTISESYSKVTDQRERMVANLVSQFKSNTPDAPNNLEKLILAYARQIQEVENVLISLRDDRRLVLGSGAVGAQLDRLGEIVGEARGGLSDDVYRQRIAARIRINIGSGTIEDILGAARAIIIALQSTSPPLRLQQNFPADFTLYVEGVISSGIEVGRQVAALKAAGVGGRTIFDTNVNTFSFSSSALPETSTTTGFSNVAMTTGGTFSWVA